MTGNSIVRPSNVNVAFRVITSVSQAVGLPPVKKIRLSYSTPHPAEGE